MDRKVIHISETEAARDFVSLLVRVRAGAEVVIEHGAEPVAVLSPATPRGGRLLSESIRLAKAHAQRLGYAPTLDADFAADLKEIISAHREPRNPPTWD